MPRKLVLTFLFALFLVTYGFPAHAQETPDEDTQEAAAPDAEAAPQPETPKNKSTIIVDNGRLSVEFVDVNFGEILRSIGQKAGFQVEGSSPAFSKPVTTKFTDLDIDSAVVRLFSLVRENNYLISYDAKGSVAKVKIPSASVAAQTPSYRPGATRGAQMSSGPSRIVRGRRMRVFSQPGVPGAPAPTYQPPSPQPEEDEEEPEE